MKDIKVTTIASKYQQEVEDDFKSHSEFAGTEFLYDINKKTVYAKCSDGFVQIDKHGCKAIQAIAEVVTTNEDRSFFDTDFGNSLFAFNDSRN